MPPTNQQPAYTPPQYLLAGTGLSEEELIMQYQGFYRNLQNPRATPELMFERLVGNLMGVSGAALSREREDHAAAEEAWDLEKASLESDLARVITLARKRGRALRASRVEDLVPSPVPVYETYVQFWFLAPNHVRATTTNIPIPYGIGYGCTEIDHCTSSGQYDSREDPLITTATLPTEIVRYVSLETPCGPWPRVVAWLTGVSAPTGMKACAQVAARKITEAGFELHIRSNGGVPIGSVGVAWAIFETKGRGEHPSLEVDTSSTPWRGWTPLLRDDCVLLDRGPSRRVGFAAICELALVLEERVWVEMKVDMELHPFSTKCPIVRIKVGPVDSKVYSVGMVCYTVHDAASDNL